MTPGGRLRKCRSQGGEDRHHDKLDAVEPDAVQLLGQNIDEHDLHREGSGGDQDQQIADVDLRHAHAA